MLCFSYMYALSMHAAAAALYVHKKDDGKDGLKIEKLHRS